ncbi:hypothetical protein [Sporosarcina sp. Marseille-Q4943]|uniref:hypothetical protein n=1 Tax=Sporosarcina sp. Marseille-Q4943 TaxID=2942204 RepID=UPI00208DD983|nr:hypothetical protein [Sporosarcina sp. Marseille-Q4943]
MIDVDFRFRRALSAGVASASSLCFAPLRGLQLTLFPQESPPSTPINGTRENLTSPRLIKIIKLIKTTKEIPNTELLSRLYYKKF